MVAGGVRNTKQITYVTLTRPQKKKKRKEKKNEFRVNDIVFTKYIQKRTVRNVRQQFSFGLFVRSSSSLFSHPLNVRNCHRSYPTFHHHFSFFLGQLRTGTTKVFITYTYTYKYICAHVYKTTAIFSNTNQFFFFLQ